MNILDKDTGFDTNRPPLNLIRTLCVALILGVFVPTNGLYASSANKNNNRNFVEQEVQSCDYESDLRKHINRYYHAVRDRQRPRFISRKDRRRYMAMFNDFPNNKIEFEDTMGFGFFLISSIHTRARFQTEVSNSIDEYKDNEYAKILIEYLIRMGYAASILDQMHVIKDKDYFDHTIKALLSIPDHQADTIRTLISEEIFEIYKHKPYMLDVMLRFADLDPESVIARIDYWIDSDRADDIISKIIERDMSAFLRQRNWMKSKKDIQIISLLLGKNPTVVLDNYNILSHHPGFRQYISNSSIGRHYPDKVMYILRKAPSPHIRLEERSIVLQITENSVRVIINNPDNIAFISHKPYTLDVFMLASEKCFNSVLKLMLSRGNGIFYYTDISKFKSGRYNSDNREIMRDMLEKIGIL